MSKWNIKTLNLAHVVFCVVHPFYQATIEIDFSLLPFASFSSMPTFNNFYWTSNADAACIVIEEQEEIEQQ